MEQEGQQALYDFLYKDDSLIASYNAQIYRGHLERFTKETAVQSSVSSEVKGSIPAVLSASLDGAKGASSKDVSSYIPHDTATLDLMHSLAPALKKVDDPSLKRGDFLIIQAPLYIFTKSLLLNTIDIFIAMKKE